MDTKKSTLSDASRIVICVCVCFSFSMLVCFVFWCDWKFVNHCNYLYLLKCFLTTYISTHSFCAPSHFLTTNILTHFSLIGLYPRYKWFCFAPRDSQFQDIFNPTWLGSNSLALPWCIIWSEIRSSFIVTTCKGPEVWNWVYWHAEKNLHAKNYHPG